MNVFEFSIAIVALVFLAKLMNTAMRQKRFGQRDDAANVQLMERLNQVEERVRVLERIVTDERFDLKQQFKDLGS